MNFIDSFYFNFSIRACCYIKHFHSIYDFPDTMIGLRIPCSCVFGLANTLPFYAPTADWAIIPTSPWRNSRSDDAIFTSLSTDVSNTRISRALSQIVFDKLTPIFFVLTRLWRPSNHHHSKKKHVANHYWS